MNVINYLKQRRQIRDLQAEVGDIKDVLYEYSIFNDYTGIEHTNQTTRDETRIINRVIPAGTFLDTATIDGHTMGQLTLKLVTRNSDGTFNLLKDLKTVSISTGENKVFLGESLAVDAYLAFYAADARVQAYSSTDASYIFTGDLIGNNVVVTRSHWNVKLSVSTRPELSIVEKLNTDFENSKTTLYSKNFMQIFPKYTVIGDSLTAGFMSVGGVSVGSSTAVTTKNNWPGYLELRTGRTFTNIAVGGSKARDWRNTHIVEANIPTDCYLVALGVNDLRSSLPVGAPSDIDTDFINNGDTFYGNYDYVVRQLLAYNPNSRVFVLTIPKNESANAENYNAAIRYVADLYQNVHLIDMYNLYGTEFTTGFLADNFINGHFTPMSYNYISEMIEKAICDYIVNNYTNFQTVPYE